MDRESKRHGTPPEYLSTHPSFGNMSNSLTDAKLISELRIALGKDKRVDVRGRSDSGADRLPSCK